MTHTGPPTPGLLTIELESETPIYRQIIHAIRRQIVDGLLQPDMALPSVRQLAADLDINPNTVSKSYLLLERDGILVSHKRKGYYVAPAARNQALAGDRNRLDQAMDVFLAAGRDLGLANDSLLQALTARIADDENGGD